MRTAARATPAIFDVAKGTAAFVAAAVAKTGDMKITTPTATLGIRGTTGLVEVPEGAAANNPNNVAVKLYPDADGRVGRIEVNDRAGARLGFLTQGASGFTIRPGTGGARFAAVPLAIPQAVMLRDQGFVRQLHAAQNVGRQVVFQQREFRRANPASSIRTGRSGRFQPGQPRQNGAAAARAACPDNRPASCQPVQASQGSNSLAFPATRSAAAAGAPNRQGDSSSPARQPRPGHAARAGQPHQPGRANQLGQAARVAGNRPPISATCQPQRRGHQPRPECRRAQAPQQPAVAARSPARRGTAAAEQVGVRPDCSARPAFRALRGATSGTAPRTASPRRNSGKPPKEQR